MRAKHFLLCNCNTQKTYRQKPNKNEVAAIQKSGELSVPIELTIKQLSEALLHGCNCRASAVKGSSQKEFISQQLIALDVDNKNESTKHMLEHPLLPEEALKKVRQKGLEPFLIYQTHSSSEKWLRYRMLFYLSKPITDIKLAKEATEKLVGVLGSDGAIGYGDTCVTNPCQILFGTHYKEPLYCNYDAVNDVEDILRLPSLKSRDQIKPKKPKAIKTNANIEAIKRHDAVYLRNKLGSRDPIICHSYSEFYEYVQHLDMAELLELEEKKSFTCILDDCSDQKPSANIFITEYGIWKYHCFKCKRNLNILQLIQKLGSFESAYQSYQFIQKIYNIEMVESEWVKQTRYDLNDIARQLSGDEFDEQCPTASKNIRNARTTLLQIVTIAQQTVSDERKSKDSGELVFSISSRQIAKAINKPQPKVQNYLKILIYHKIIRIVPDDQVPEHMLQRALRYAKSNRHICFYSIKSFVIDHLESVEERGISWKANNYKVKGISYEMFYRAEGYEVAAELYPNSSKKKIDTDIINKAPTKASDKRTEILMEITIELIAEQGFCTEKQILRQIESLKSFMDKQLQRSISEIMTANNLVKVRANKALKAKYHIQTKGYPIIIIKA